MGIGKKFTKALGGKGHILGKKFQRRLGVGMKKASGIATAVAPFAGKYSPALMAGAGVAQKVGSALEK